MPIVTVATEEHGNVDIQYQHRADGVWEADIGNGFEEYASFDDSPREEDSFQQRTVAQLLRKEFDEKYGGDPGELKLE